MWATQAEIWQREGVRNTLLCPSLGHQTYKFQGSDSADNLQNINQW